MHCLTIFTAQGKRQRGEEDNEKANKRQKVDEEEAEGEGFVSQQEGEEYKEHEGDEEGEHAGEGEEVQYAEGEVHMVTNSTHSLTLESFTNVHTFAMKTHKFGY